MINPISSATSILQTVLNGTTSKTSQTSSTTLDPTDTSSLSEFATLIKQLETLQKSDPAQFKQDAAKVSDQLQTAAQQASNVGDSQTTGTLNDLAAKFKSASETGQMPYLGASNTPTNSTSTDLLALFQTSQSNDPMELLTDVLKKALTPQYSWISQ